MSYTLFEHTADLGLRIEAGDLDQLFADAGLGLFAIITESLETVAAARSRQFQLQEADVEYMLVDWLTELLLAFESDGWLFCRFEVHVAEGTLTATAWASRSTWLATGWRHEVKAVTYHGLSVKRDGAAGWPR